MKIDSIRAKRFVAAMVARFPLLPVIALVLANLMPLWGVLFRGWTVLEVMLLFALENLVIGGFTVLRMSVVTGRAKVAQICFFVFHYGVFTLAHCLFVFAFFGHNAIPNMDTPYHAFAGLFKTLGTWLDPFAKDENTLWPFMFALVVSHAISFGVNFIGRREFARTQLESLVFRPYGRLAVLHISVLLGGGLAELAGSHIAALILLVLLKIALDTRGHWKERLALL